MRTFIVYLLYFSLSATYVYADEDDLEFDFSIKQKSTLADFPMQEIGADELSSAAIAGALQATSADAQEKTGKPAYAQELEDSEKRQQEELEEPNNEQRPDDILKFSQAVPILIEFPQEPFKLPNGRELTHFNKYYEHE